jgi:Bacterial archaeo-eukaryotic release factor family 3
VILAGVEYEVSLYRTQSSFPRLLDLSIHGAPNSLKGGEMHSRALELMEQHRLQQAEKVIAEYNHLAGGGRATNRLKEIVTAAHDGRVNKLVLSDTLEVTGAMDDATHQVSGSKNAENEQYDLLNDAAVQTILHAGQVHAAPNQAMPNGTPIIAVFRY